MTKRSPENASTLPNAIDTVGPGASTTCVSYVTAMGGPRNPTVGRLGATASLEKEGMGFGDLVGAGVDGRACAKTNEISIEQIILKFLSV